MARPTVYNEEVKNEICGRISEGESLRSVCASDNLPAISTIMDWLVKNTYPEFSEQYTRSRHVQYLLMADEILDIADNGANDYMIRHHKDDEAYSLNGEHVQRSRIRLDTRKWVLCKMLPKIYGDKPETVNEDAPPLNITFEVSPAVKDINITKGEKQSNET